MSASTTDIANMALARIGEARIMSLDESTPAARACREFYESTRDEVLRSHRWNFARERAILSKLEDAPAFGWAYQYQLPNDCLRVLEVNGTEHAMEDLDRWEIEGRKLLTDAESVELIYVRKLTDPSQFDPLFVEALVLKLASKIAATRRGSSSQVSNFLEEYARLTAPLARRIDSNESRPRERLLPTESVFVGARRAAYGYTVSSASGGSGGYKTYSASEIAALYAQAVDQVSSGEITAGTEAALRTFSPANVKAMIDAHAAGGGGGLTAAMIDTLAELNAILTDATLIDTGDPRLSDARTPTAHTHPASEISDASANGRAILTAATYAAMRTLLNVADGANNYSHPNHTGDVTSTGDGATVIANDAVTYAKMQNVSATDRLLGRSTAGAGDVEEITCTPFARTLLDDADGSAARTTIGCDAAGTDNAPAASTTVAGKIEIATQAEVDAGTDTARAVTPDTLNGWSGVGLLEQIGIAVSDESTDLTTGTAKVTFRMPFAMTLSEVRASVNTAPTGAALQVDINEAGASVLSTVLSIDASEKTSETAATPAVISDSALADDAEMTIDIDQVGSTTAGKGLKIWLIGRRA